MAEETMAKEVLAEEIKEPQQNKENDDFCEVCGEDTANCTCEEEEEDFDDM